MKRKCLTRRLYLFLFSLLLPGIGLAISTNRFSTQSTPDSSWSELRRGFKLIDHYYDEAVTDEVRQFSQRYFDRLRNRILSYQAYLNTRVRDRNIPAELALLPLIESALNAEARSPANAVGFWQFMPDTAREYGLKINNDKDGRKDLVLATNAALNLLERLYDETGDWLQTIAAYNAGGSILRKAVMKSDSSSFWDLRLPVETRRHVAKLLALSSVIFMPDQYNLVLPTLKPM